jgi:hypothetical protein
MGAPGSRLVLPGIVVVVVACRWQRLRRKGDGVNCGRKGDDSLE